MLWSVFRESRRDSLVHEYRYIFSIINDWYVFLSTVIDRFRLYYWVCLYKRMLHCESHYLRREYLKARKAWYSLKWQIYWHVLSLVLTREIASAFCPVKISVTSWNRAAFRYNLLYQVIYISPVLLFRRIYLLTVWTPYITPTSLSCTHI